MTQNTFVATLALCVACASSSAADVENASANGCAPPPKSSRPITTTPRATGNTATSQADADPNQTVVVYCSAPSAAKPTGSDDSHPWLDFWSKVIPALSWPIVALIAAWRLAPYFKGKLKDLTRVKAGPVEAEFAKQVEELRKEVEERVPEARTSRTIGDDEARLLELAKISPRSAIIEAWRNVELSAAKAVETRLARRDQDSKFTSLRTALNTTALGRELGLLQILNGQQVSLFHELRILRNKATHSEDFVIEFETVNNYIQLAQSLQQILRTAENEDSHPVAGDA